MSTQRNVDAVHYTFKLVETDDGFKATEPNTGVDRWGVGPTAQAAIIDYCKGVGK